MTQEMREVRLEDIELSQTAAQIARRKRFKNAELEDLIASVSTHGVLQPVILRSQLRGPKYQMVAGERRYLASSAADRETIPAVIREFTDEEVLQVQLIENLQRKDVHPMEEAEGYQELVQKYRHPVEELHERVGKSRSYVYGRLKLLALSKKARDAFYDSKISASIALLIARIPGHKLQDQALKDMTEYGGSDISVSFRRAKEIVHDNYMLRLKGAPFPTGDADLHKQAGPCNTCPKRTGNQPELFGDVESADVCTDPVCFAVKRKEHGDRRIKEAQKSGQTVLTGKAAKDITHPYSDHLSGYYRLNHTTYHEGKNRTVRAIVGKDAETTLVQLPKTGEVVEVVKHSVVNAALTKNAPARRDDAYARQVREQARKLKIERGYRKALYAEVRPHLPPPPLRLIARQLLDRMENEVEKVLTDLCGIEVKEKKQSWGTAYKDHGGSLSKHLEQLPDDELAGFVNDAIYANELQVSSYTVSRKAKELEAAAGKVPGLNAKAIRRQVTAKTKGKKKASKKKATKKKKTKTSKARSRKKKAA